MRKIIGHTIMVLLVVLIVFSVAGYLKADQEREQSYLPSYSTSMSLPAVDQDGNGVPVRLTVETKEGKDRILTNIDKLVFWADTQESIQIAKSVAKNVTKIDTYTIDLIYTVEGNNATLVGGPSAGAALTVATISVLKQMPLNQSIILTGTIDSEGNIGEVGAIEEKAEAAKKAGAKLLLIPNGTLEKTRTKAVENCKKDGGVTYCETVYKEVRFSLSEEVGIEIEEVKTIEEALKYFNL